MPRDPGLQRPTQQLVNPYLLLYSAVLLAHVQALYVRRAVPSYLSSASCKSVIVTFMPLFLPFALWSLFLTTKPVSMHAVCRKRIACYSVVNSSAGCVPRTCTMR
jgi:hypothetical protein